MPKKTLWQRVKETFWQVGAGLTELFARAGKRTAGRFNKPKTPPQTPGRRPQVLPEARLSEDTPLQPVTQVYQAAKPAPARPMGNTTRRHNGKGAKKRMPLKAYFVPRKKPNFALALVVTVSWLLLFSFCAGASAGLGSFVGLMRAYLATTPELDLTRITDSPQTSFVYAADGSEIASYRNAENRVWADIEHIPQMLRDAFVAAEDERFYQHNGVDYKRLVSVIFADGATGGGSTITQQLIKMRVLSNERSYKRKLQEAYLATQLEKTYSKDQILEAYLNTIPLGGTNYGVKAAAHDYFNKELDELSLKECATLAGITPSPTAYNPRSNYYNTGRDPAVTDKRTNIVLDQMYKNGYISLEDMEQAKAEPLEVVQKREVATSEMSMVYATEYAIRNVVEFLLKKQGLENTAQNRGAAETQIREGGYRIYTTIDPAVQSTLEETVVNYSGYPRMRHSADNVVTHLLDDGTRIEVIQPQCAVTILNTKTAEVVALMGGRQLPTRMKELNRAWQASNPVGSSIKPLTCFGPALDAGVSPGTVIANVRAPIDGWDSELGYPKNYNESQYSGPMTIREGVRRSINVVAARTLLDLVGINTAANYLAKMGVSSDHIKATGSGLALGSSGLSTLEMAQSYATVANKGFYQQPVAFTKMTDSHGETILDPSGLRDTDQVYKPGSAWMLVDMMKEVCQAGGTAGVRAQFNNGVKMTVAGKTGTNDDERGVFFSGITAYYTCTVWVGSDQYKPLPYGSAGGNTCVPLWRNIMQQIHVGLADRDIIEESPEDLNVVRVKLCGISGMKATELCSRHRTYDDWMNGDSAAAAQACTWHCEAHICGSSGLAATRFCPESEVTTSEVCVVPEDSAYRKLSTEAMRAYIPNAVFSVPGLDDVLSLPENSSELALYCSVHNPQTQYDPALPAARKEAQNTYAAGLSLAYGHENDTGAAGVFYATLKAGLDSLHNALASSGVDLATLRQRTEDVKALIKQGFPAVATPTPIPVPTPNTTPTATPTATATATARSAIAD